MKASDELGCSTGRGVGVLWLLRSRGMLQFRIHSEKHLAQQLCAGGVINAGLASSHGAFLAKVKEH